MTYITGGKDLLTLKLINCNKLVLYVFLYQLDHLTVTIWRILDFKNVSYSEPKSFN